MKLFECLKSVFLPVSKAKIESYDAAMPQISKQPRAKGKQVFYNFIQEY